MEITKRDFTRNIYSHLVEGEYVVTNKGKPEYVVTIKRVNGVVTRKEIDNVVTQNLIPEYGCGCKKEEGKVLCGKHKRY